MSFSLFRESKKLFWKIRDSMMKDHSIQRLPVLFVCILLKNLFWRFCKHLSIFDQKWHNLWSLKSLYFKKFKEFFLKKFVERRQIDVRRGMPSFASIPPGGRGLNGQRKRVFTSLFPSESAGSREFMRFPSLSQKSPFVFLTEV